MCIVCVWVFCAIIKFIVCLRLRLRYAGLRYSDDEVVKEEVECNIDESSAEDLKQETYNEEDKNELLKCEMSMQQQVMQQLTDPHNHNPLFVQFREMSLHWQLTLGRSLLQMQRIPVNQLGLKKHIQSHYCLDPCHSKETSGDT